jgi:uroporphyrin-3 C-methyltransferase
MSEADTERTEDGRDGEAGPRELPAEADAERAADGGAAEPAAGAPPVGGGVPTSLVLAASFAVLLAIAAAALTGVSWWQYRQFYVSLDGADQQLEASLQRVRAGMRGLQDRADGVDKQLTRHEERLDAFEQQLDQIPGRLSELAQRLDSVQGGSFDVREQWLAAEAEYYLRLANTELQLAGHWQNAIEALQLADGRLRELADPHYAPVRELIADELVALKSVQRPDIEGLSAGLAALAQQAAELPLRAAARPDLGDHAAADDAQPGLGRLWAKLKSALSGLIRVERREAPVQLALSAQERMLIRQRLALALQLAQLAAVRQAPDAFGAQIDSARQLLERDFDPDSASVQSAKRRLEQLRSVEVAPQPPDISESLQRLRAARGSGAAAAGR